MFQLDLLFVILDLLIVTSTCNAWLLACDFR